MSRRNMSIGADRTKAVNNFKTTVNMIKQGYTAEDISWKLNITAARVRQFIRIYNFYKHDLHRIYDYSLTLKDALSNIVNEEKVSRENLRHSDYSKYGSIKSRYKYVIHEYRKGFFIKDIANYTGWGSSFCYVCVRLYRHAPFGYKKKFYMGEWTISKCGEVIRDLLFEKSQGGSHYGK